MNTRKKLKKPKLQSKNPISPITNNFIKMNIGLRNISTMGEIQNNSQG